ncbi:DNA gyrase subunit B [Devosia sp. YIM 151766]|uniref:DUF883 family protein n=1 Tax=Devosia sp. YIM 151766 TaxID=3017325 RepID=UPI00255CC42A|nr:DNA gyrase subunit B [Devosia sp. YIM 151766]WIY51942.1 DNA gyrase subunit B [Devosia sp. YIM 151766]
MATTSDMAPGRKGGASKNTTPQRNTDPQGKERDLEAQVAQLQDDLKSITETLGKLTGDKVDEARSVAATELRELKRKGQHMLDEAQDQAEAVEKQLKDTIREKPLTAVATALGVGFVLALLTRH